MNTRCSLALVVACGLLTACTAPPPPATETSTRSVSSPTPAVIALTPITLSRADSTTLPIKTTPTSMPRPADLPSTISVTPAAGLPDLAIEPAVLNLPAGSSGRVVATLTDCDQQPAVFQAGALPAGITAELISAAAPCTETIVLTMAGSLVPGEYRIPLIRRSDSGQLATGEVLMHVSECRELQTGEFTQATQANLVPLITAGKPAIEHGLLVPLQVCGPRAITVDLLAATSEAGTAMSIPPHFYVYRSWVWPTPAGIQANAAQPWTLNVAVPRIDSQGGQLTANVPAGLYLLVFERDSYGSATDPNDIPASITYRITEGVP